MKNYRSFVDVKAFAQSAGLTGLIILVVNILFG
jgi:hypothetical protein